MEKEHALVTSTPITKTPQRVNQITKELSCKEDGCFGRIDFHELKRKKDLNIRLSRRSRLMSRVSKQMKAQPPTIEELLEAHQSMNIEKALNSVVLNYSYLSYHGVYENDLWNKSLGDSFDTNSDENLLELEQLFINESNFNTYEHALQILRKNSKRAKEILLDLVHDVVEPACFAFAVIIFKETIEKCDVLNNSKDNNEAIENNKNDIKDAVQLLKFSEIMEPAPSFLLGMLKRYNIGNINRFIDDRHEWEEDLVQVIDAATKCGIFNIPQYVFDFGYKNKEKCGLGMKEKKDYLKEMSKYAIYEIAIGISPERYYLNAQIDLLNILLREEFPQALFVYAALLLQKKIGQYWTSEQVVEEAIGHLNRAILAKYDDAKILLGILPFYTIGPRLTFPQIDRCIHYLEFYINFSGGDCFLNEQNIDKAAYCLAVQYYTKSYILLQDRQKAKKLLTSRNLHEKFLYLQSQEALQPKSEISAIKKDNKEIQG